MSIKIINGKVFHESSGGFLFYEDPADHQLYVALLQTSDLAVMIPKGHIEKGETPEQAAVREIQEELGVKDIPKIVGKIGTDTYDFMLDEDDRNHQKKVHLFSLELKTKVDLSPLRKEGFTGAEWYPFEEAQRKITFDKQNILEARQNFYFYRGYIKYGDYSEIKNISIGIPTHNGSSTIVRCMTSINEAVKLLSTDISVELTVCTDHCEDKTFDMVKQQIEKMGIKTKVIENDGEKGKSTVLNLLYKSLNNKTDLVFFIDDDIEVDPRCFVKMIDALIADNQYRFFFAEWVRKSYKKRSTYQNFWYKVFGIKFDIQIYSKKSQLMRGACMLFRSSDYVKIPKNIINDDQFLQYIYWPSTKEVEGAKTYFDSVDNLSDYKNRFLRIGLGMDQIEDEFSKDRLAKCKKDLFLEIDKNKIRKLDFSTKFYYKTYRIIRSFVSRWVAFKLKKGEHNGWYRTRKS